MPNHKERLHATLGASSAHRWMACPGSVELTRDIPDRDTDYSREGTAAHELAELCLSKDVAAALYQGTELHGFEVDADMVAGVQLFLDTVKARVGHNGQMWSERRVDLAALNPPAPMFGTLDAQALAGRRLSIIDLKYGRGVIVEVENNPQLFYYALGALLALPPGTAVDEVEIVVVQPRASHEDGQVRSQVVPVEDLLGFADKLMERARATQQPDAPLVVGDHCRFCPAIGRCPAHLSHAVAVAQVEFDAVAEPVPPDPRLLTPDQLADLLPKLDVLEKWLTGVRAAAFDLAAHGTPIRGRKLVAKRANRKWTNEKEVVSYLSDLGLTDDDIHDKTVRSVAQIEKVIGRDALPEDLITKESSGVVLVPESDKRPAVALHPGDDFAALTGETQHD